MATIAPVLRKTKGLVAHIETYPGNIKIEFEAGSVTKGYFRASEVSMKSFEWDTSPDVCKAEWERQGRPTLWVVRGAEWHDPKLRGGGGGKRIYRALLDAVEAYGGVLAPGMCAGGGTTSPSAKGVWKAIYRDFPDHAAVFQVPL